MEGHALTDQLPAGTRGLWTDGLLLGEVEVLGGGTVAVVDGGLVVERTGEPVGPLLVRIPRG